MCDYYVYSDFVCWTTKGLHIERIQYDAAFFGKIKPKLDLYFCTVMLPRMIQGKRESNKENSKEQLNKEKYCFCRKGEYGKMIACDGPNCKYEWFHFTCVNLKVAPKGNWFCSDCLSCNNDYHYVSYTL